MKTLILRLSVATLVLGVMSTPARAQDTVVSRGDVAIKPTFASLTAAITNTPATLEKLLAVQNINEADVTPVDVKPLLVGQGDDVLKIQLERREADIKQLRELLKKHAGVAARLKKESAEPSIGDVIAAQVDADGKVTLYYKKD
jgi:hypothetical protein